jgi:hypothetical protein
MHRGFRYLSVFCLTALAAPAIVCSSRCSDRSEHHDWDDNEEHVYHRYLDEQHREYREFGKLKSKEQQEYWDWRHNHADEHDRGHDREQDHDRH